MWANLATVAVIRAGGELGGHPGSQSKQASRETVPSKPAIFLLEVRMMSCGRVVRCVKSLDNSNDTVKARGLGRLGIVAAVSG